ncbi:unnamed protein product [Dracunculus medinensis]|uniref:26S proteasome non-ATPase regulatory subunit 8 n=1 Tax=Dracunculus medinensis TaxID=318479 RepID=A0A0N4U1N7_DRAME|nr:unnamed protein product [Dracunculus medinensis]
MYENLIRLWKKPLVRDMEAIGKTLMEIKEGLNHLDGMKTLQEDALFSIHRKIRINFHSIQKLKTHSKFVLGDVYEIDALYAILRCDLDAFNEANTITLSFYENCGNGQEFPNKYLMIGLHLMYLLATNRLAEFHMLLEQVDQSVQQQNPYISTPVKLEQSLMEGVYNKVILTEKTIPSPYYSIFIRILMDTIRGEIAACIESSFTQVPIKDATQLLLFSNQSEVHPFAKKRGWKFEKDAYVFDVEKPVEPLPKAHLDTIRIANQALFYAKQLEMIV